jgi:deoxyribonuclease V
MALGFNFYVALHEILEQIPENRVTTPMHLALTLGDPIADRAVIEAMNREDLRVFASKVAQHPSNQEKVFTDFYSDTPLKRLAELQRSMAGRVVLEDHSTDLRRVAGVDAAYSDDVAHGACVVMDRELNIVESQSVVTEAPFPYIPGYLAFREAPAILSAARDTSGFDVLLVNGHGVAHPRGCGLATFVGLELDAPTIGVARRRLAGDVGADRGGWSPVTLRGVVVGAEIRETGRTPIYVSAGHLISLESSLEIVRGFRVEGGLPEPLRLAHMKAEEESRRARLSTEMRRPEWGDRPGSERRIPP